MLDTETSVKIGTTVKMQKTVNKVLIPIGDASETVDTLYPYYRLQEAGFVPVVAGPERRTYQMVLHEVRPGFIRTPMTTAGEGSSQANIEAHLAAGDVPQNRWGEEADVGKTVTSLASGGLPFTIGHPIYVDGGFGIKTAGRAGRRQEA